MSQLEASYIGKINSVDYKKIIDNYKSDINNLVNNTVLLKFNMKKFKHQHQLKDYKIKSQDLKLN